MWSNTIEDFEVSKSEIAPTEVAMFFKSFLAWLKSWLDAPTESASIEPLEDRHARRATSHN